MCLISFNLPYSAATMGIQHRSIHKNSLNLFTHYYSVSWCLGVQRLSDNDMWITLKSWMWGKTLQATYVERKELVEEMHKLLSLLGRLDQKIAPMMEADGALFNQR